MTENTPARIPLKRWRLVAAAVTTACCLLGLALLGYGICETGRLECNDVSIPERILPGCKGLRIALLSDVHGNQQLLERAVDMTLAARPDLVVMPGDFFTATQRISRSRHYIAQLRRLSAACPVYASLGNHDIEKLANVQRILERGGVTLLRNESVRFHSDRLHCDLVITGVGDWLEDDIDADECLASTSAASGANGPPVLLLCHHPVARKELKDYAWNLMVSGHTHGNQARNPFTGKPFFFRDGDTLTEGYLEENGSAIYVTRGIGTQGLRFFCPPEINILTVD